MPCTPMAVSMLVRWRWSLAFFLGIRKLLDFVLELGRNLTDTTYVTTLDKLQSVDKPPVPKTLCKPIYSAPTLECHQLFLNRNRNRNCKLQTSKAPLKSQAQGNSLFTSAASNQRGFPKNSPWEAQVRFPEGERMRQIRGVFQRIVRGKLRSGCQKVRGGRLGVKAGVV